MIGNDVVDLTLSRTESNWQRKGFLDKIFSEQEKFVIERSNNQESTVWNIWTRKEAAYKIFVQETKIQGYFPHRIKCFFESETCGLVSIDNQIYHTKTEITAAFIRTFRRQKITMMLSAKTVY